jgi:hypothetical protein
LRVTIGESIQPPSAVPRRPELWGPTDGLPHLARYPCGFKSLPLAPCPQARPLWTGRAGHLAGSGRARDRCRPTQRHDQPSLAKACGLPPAPSRAQSPLSPTVRHGISEASTPGGEGSPPAVLSSRRAHEGSRAPSTAILHTSADAPAFDAPPRCDPQ